MAREINVGDKVLVDGYGKGTVTDITSIEANMGVEKMVTVEFMEGTEGYTHFFNYHAGVFGENEIS